jgi:hypothetical protein
MVLLHTPISLLQKHRQPGLEITQRLWPVHSAQNHAEGMCCVDTAAVHKLQWQLQLPLLPTLSVASLA